MRSGTLTIATVGSLIAGLAIALTASLSPDAEACTGLRVHLKDGTAVHGRTLEFGAPLDSQAIFVPKGAAYTGTLPDNGTGLQWTARHAAMGMSPGSFPFLVDGLNDAGLGGGLFYFPGCASYAAVTAESAPKSVAPHEFVTWVLTTMGSVSELRDAVHRGSVAIAPTPITLGEISGVQPMHCVFYDKDGTSIVIEPTNGTLVIHDNPLGVLTNSPEFDWHMKNLCAYSNLSTVQGKPLTLDSVRLEPWGQGPSLHGLPGDFTPASRFVRAAIFSASAPLSESRETAVTQAFHLLNNFDLPDGSCGSPTASGVAYDITEWTVVRDPVAMRYYFRTRENQGIGYMELGMFDPKATAAVLKPLPMKQEFAQLAPFAPSAAAPAGR